MIYETKNYDTDKNVSRLQALPAPYLIVLEEIVDNLDKDWKNRLVYGYYIAYLLDIFEPAVKEGKEIKDIVGDNVKEYALQFQKDVDFRNNEPTLMSTLLNGLLIANFLMATGFISLNPIIKGMLDGKAVATSEFLFIAVALVIFVVAFVIKMKKYKVIDLDWWLYPIQLIVMALGCYLLQFEMLGILIGIFICIIWDYMLISKQLKR